MAVNQMIASFSGTHSLASLQKHPSTSSHYLVSSKSSSLAAGLQSFSALSIK